jgi:hypothetical protein
MDMRIIILFISFLAGCSVNKSENEKFEFYSVHNVHKVNDSLNALIIHNPADYEVYFSFNINKNFPLSINRCIEEIKQSEVAYPQSAWQFVVDKTFHSLPFASANWQHRPELFLNSLGGGLCDDRASVLAYLFKAMGDSARIVGLNGHIVTEIYYNNKWQLFDPDNGIYYCDQNGVVLSVDELEENPEQMIMPRIFCNEQLVNPVFRFSNAVTTRFAGYYASTDDNIDVSEWHIPFYNTDSVFILPSTSSLIITLGSNGTIANIVVELTEGSKGRVKIPFVAARADGQFDFIYEEKTNSVRGTGFVFPAQQIIDGITIEGVTEVSNIYYLINQKLKPIKEANSVELFSSSQLDFNQENKTLKTIKFAEEFLFFDTVQDVYPRFYSNLQPLKNGSNIKNYLMEEYVRFLKSEGILPENEIADALNQLRIDINLLSKDDQHLRLLIEKNYPKSVFYLFAASKHNRIDYLNKLINDEK